MRNLSREEIELMEDWLNLKSKQVDKSESVTDKNRFNNKYLGVIKFINSINGKIIYTNKRVHKITLKELPDTVEVSNLNSYEKIGVVEILLNAGILTSLTEKIISIKGGN